ncbi:MAG: hypothetical protein KME31_16540 [Tolypothrix carrinoi HA7290-LM1]|jgi:hypothetical protein|nr:hypothetical protein [Tolypothrix carrinoi HA7290-LM1]
MKLAFSFVGCGLAKCVHYPCLPEFNKRLPEFNKRLPEFNKRLPEFNKRLPEFDKRLPEFDKQLPEFDKRLPEFDKRLPEFNKRQVLGVGLPKYKDKWEIWLDIKLQLLTLNLQIFFATF